VSKESYLDLGKAVSPDVSNSDISHTPKGVQSDSAPYRNRAESQMVCNEKIKDIMMSKMINKNINYRMLYTNKKKISVNRSSQIKNLNEEAYRQLN
jgi:hypothetical protein